MMGKAQSCPETQLRGHTTHLTANTHACGVLLGNLVVEWYLWVDPSYGQADVLPGFDFPGWVVLVLNTKFDFFGGAV